MPAPSTNKPHYDKAIGGQMHAVKKSATPEQKDRMKRILIHLNVARDLETLGHGKFAITMLKIANELAKASAGGPAVATPAALPPSPDLNRAIGMCMHVIKRATPEEKITAKQALSHFNLARTCAGLGYGKLSNFLIKYGENLLAQIDPSLPPEERTRRRWDNEDLVNPPPPARPMPPQTGNPILRTIDNAIWRIKSKLDGWGINL